MMGEAEKQKAIRALFPSTAGVLEGEDGRAAQSQGEVGGTRRDGMGWDGGGSVQQQLLRQQEHEQGRQDTH